jgi:signal transduction histidine kinase
VVEAISAQAMRADTIVSRLQDFVRRREPRREPVDVNAVVEEAASLIAAEARQRRISLQRRLEPGLQTLHADGVQIEQVVLNLARNGFDAMQEVDDVRRVLTIETRSREGSVEVAVADRGEGIASSDAERIFAPFFSTKPNGLGMGLAICRSIVAAHGGTLWATANEDHGTTFCFSLPAAT